MFKFGNYTIRREALNFVVDVTRKNLSKPQKDKKWNPTVTKHLGFFGSFKQAVNRIANDVVLTEEQGKIIETLDEISAKLNSLDVKIVCGELSTKSCRRAK